jgi:hypothetical protein
VVQSLVDGAPEAALSAITGTSGTARTVTAVTASVASTTSLVSSPSHYSSSYGISNDNPYSFRQAHAATSLHATDTSRVQQRNDYHAIRSQQQEQQQQQQQGLLQQFVGGSTSSTASERFTTSSATTARTLSDMSSRHNQLANTVDRQDDTATASSFSFSSSSSSSSLLSPTLAMVLSSSTIKDPGRPTASVITQIHQLVDRRRKDDRKSIVLDSAT